MSKLSLLPLLLLLNCVVVVTVFAESSIVTAIPGSIPTNGNIQLKIENLSPATTDQVQSITVTDPLGNVFSYVGALPIPVPNGAPVFVGFGSASVANWNKISGPGGNPTLTGVSGQYHVAVLYQDQSRGNAVFDCSAFFNVPEFAIGGAVTATALGFVGLALTRRRTKKSE